MGINFDLIRNITTLSTSIDNNGDRWHNEVNLISWNGGKPVFDIREWDEDHNRMRYGVKLDRDELVNLQQGISAFLKEIEAAR